MRAVQRSSVDSAAAHSAAAHSAADVMTPRARMMAVRSDVTAESIILLATSTSGILNAFESGCAAVEGRGREVCNIADDLMLGLRQLPLVKS